MIFEALDQKKNEPNIKKIFGIFKILESIKIKSCRWAPEKIFIMSLGY